jgi:hypothetical protein
MIGQKAVAEHQVSFQADGIILGKDCLMPITLNAFRLRGFCSDNQMYVHNYALEHNRCKSSKIIKPALMITRKSFIGDVSNDC